MTFEELQEAYLRELAGRGCKYHTLRGEKSRLEKFVDFCRPLGLTRLNEVKLDHVMTYYAQLHSYSPMSRYHRVATVRRWLNWAHHRDHLLANPVSDWAEKHPPMKMIWVPTERQMHQVLETEPLESARRFLLEFLYGTGLRVQECADLDLEDLDLAERRLYVRKGKNNKPRMLPLGPSLCTLARHYLDHLRPKNDCSALFLNDRQTRLNAFTINVRVRKAGLACNFPKFSVHSIRRAFATHLIQNGAPLPAVKELLGHDSYRTTQSYTRLALQDVEEMIAVSHPRARRKSTKPPRT